MLQLRDIVKTYKTGDTLVEALKGEAAAKTIEQQIVIR